MGEERTAAQRLGLEVNEALHIGTNARSSAVGSWCMATDGRSAACDACTENKRTFSDRFVTWAALLEAPL